MNENEAMVTTEMESNESIDTIETTSSNSGLIKLVGGALLVAAGAAICKKLKNKSNKPKKKLRLAWVVEEEETVLEEVDAEEIPDCDVEPAEE